MKRFDRPLAWILGLPPLFLSNRVERPTYRLPGGLRIQFRHWLWKQRAVSHCAVLVLLIALTLVTLSYAVGRTWSAFDGSGTASMPDVSPGMLAVVGYAGAMFGFLQVVLTFAAQLRWAGGVTLQPVTAFVARQYYAFETIALTGGIAVANIIVAHGFFLMESNHEGMGISYSSEVLATMLVVNLVLAPIVTALSIRLFAKIFTVAASGDLAAIMPVVQSTMVEALNESDWMIARAVQFVAELRTIGLTYDAYANSSLRRGTNLRLPIVLGVDGQFVDVDMIQLEKFSKRVRQVATKPNAVFVALPGQAWSDKHGVIITFDNHKSELPTHHLHDPRQMRAIKRRLARAIQIDPKRSQAAERELRQLQDAIGGTLEVLAREVRHVELKSLLESLSTMLDAWLDVVPDDAEPPARTSLFKVVDHFAGPVEIDLRNLAETTARTESPRIVEIVLNANSRLTAMCMHRKQYRLMLHYLGPIVYLYYQCKDKPHCMEAAGTRLDSILDQFLGISMMSTWDDNAPVDLQQLYTVLRFSLSLVHAAIYLQQPKHADHFVERIFNRDGYHSIRPHRQTRTPHSADQQSAIDYIAILLLGWSVEVLTHGERKHHDAALQVFRRAAQGLPSREEVVAIWELYYSDINDESKIDTQLGIENWDIRDWTRDYRTGIVTTSSRHSQWRENGLRAALLLASEPFYGDTESIFPHPPNRHMWDPNAEREAMLKIASLDAMGIPESDRSTRVDAAASIIHQRAHAADKHYLKYVLTSDISLKLLTHFRDEARDGRKNYRSCIDAFSALGLHHGVVLVCPFPTVVSMWVPREYLLDDNNWASGIGEHLGQRCGLDESVQLVGMIEEMADSTEPIHSLAVLPQQVRSAVHKLRDRGYEPNALILPKEDRFAGALFRKPTWQIEGRRSFGNESVGDWEGLHVLRFPYTNPKSILLLSTKSLLVKHEPLIGTQLEINIDDSPEHKDARAARLAAFQAIELAGSTLPKSSSILALATMTVYPTLGIHDPRAMIKLSIENSDGGYAIFPGSEFYHRPSCSEIQHLSPEYVLSIPRESSLKPCPKCRPELWNQEGRRGLVDGENDEESDEDALPDVK